MKSYYNDYYMFNTPEGKDLWKELNAVITPIIKREFNAGFNPSEITDMVNSVVQVEIAALRLRRSCDKIKENRSKG